MHKSEVEKACVKILGPKQPISSVNSCVGLLPAFWIALVKVIIIAAVSSIQLRSSILVS